MKTIAIILLLIFIHPNKTPLEIFTKDVSFGWSYKIRKNTLTFTRDSEVDIQYCDYSRIINEPVKFLTYIVTIDYTDKLTQFEIDNRMLLQDSIEVAYEKAYDLKPDKWNYGRIVQFAHNKNKIDSLRLPFASDENYSYFIEDNFPWGHCFIDDSVKVEIEKIKVNLEKKK